MIHRFAMLIAGIALAAGSVAPAQLSPYPVRPAAPQMALNDLPSLPSSTRTDPFPISAEPLVFAGVSEPVPAEPVPAESAVPPVSKSASLATKVAELRATDPGTRELECLAAGVYFESKSESLAGQVAVAQVIANRANSKGRFPSSYCGVLFQRGQFSFIRAGRWPSIAKGGQQWKNAVAVARIVDGDFHSGPVPRALFFHARRVSPGWKLTRVGSVGNHIFYR